MLLVALKPVRPPIECPALPQHATTHESRRSGNSGWNQGLEKSKGCSRDRDQKLPLQSVTYAVDNSLNNSPIWRQHWLCRGCSKNRHMRRHGESEHSRSLFKTRISRDWRHHFLKSRVQRVSSTWHRASRTEQYPRSKATKFAVQHTGTPSRLRQSMSVRTSMSSDPV